MACGQWWIRRLVLGSVSPSTRPCSSNTAHLLFWSAAKDCAFARVWSHRFAIAWLESLSAALAPEHWVIHGGEDPDTCTGKCQGLQNCATNNPMVQRNCACDAGIQLVMGSNLSMGLNTTGEQLLGCGNLWISVQQKASSRKVDLSH